MKTRSVTSCATLASVLFCSGIGALCADDSSKTTTVYKVINPDGSISFSDVPQDKAEKLKVAPITTIPALEIQQNAPLPAAKKPLGEKPRYDKLTITYPSDGAVFHSGDGNIPVSIEVSPPLKYGDKLVLLLDEENVTSQQDKKFNLQHVSRGTHTLILKITDANDRTIRSTRSEFTLHRPKKAR